MSAIYTIPRPVRQWSVLLGALGLVWILAISETTGSPISKDASENLRMALNLERHGVISMDERPPYHPSMWREPVPIAVLAVAIYTTDIVLGKAEPSAYFQGARARYLKLSNLGWLTLLTISAFLAIRYFTSSFLLSLLGSTFVALDFTWLVPPDVRSWLGIDGLDTEVAGAALFVAASLLLAVGVARRSRLEMIGASLCFALCALTKAALFYVYIGALGVLAAYWAIAAIRLRAGAPRLSLASLGALTIPFLLVTMSWMYRNQVQTGHFQIAERSGSGLMYRALMDDATAEEYRGMFAVWGEPHLRRIVSWLTGFSDADLEAGGRLQRLSEKLSGEAEKHEQWAEEAGRPDQTITWYRTGRAIYEAKLAQFTREGNSYPSGAADLATRNDAIKLIVQRPIKFAAMMVPLIWRSASLTFPVLLVAFLYGWRRARVDLLLFVLPAIGLVLFYAAASQFVPRYGFVFGPTAIVALLILCAAAETALGRTRSQAPAAPAVS